MVEQNNISGTCALHGVFEDVLSKLDAKTESIASIKATLDSLNRTIKGNGRGSLTERMAVLEREVTDMDKADLGIRVQRLEDRLEQFVGAVEKLRLEDTVNDVRNLTAFYNGTRSFFFKLSIPLVVTAILGIVGLFLNFWAMLQG